MGNNARPCLTAWLLSGHMRPCTNRNDVKPERQSLREAQRELTRNQIMAGARTCFLRKLYTEVSVEEIAAEARVSRATFYNHFDDKKVLLAAMVDHFLQPIGETYRQLLLIQPRSRAQVDDWVRTTFESREALRDDIRIAQQAGVLDPALSQLFFVTFGDVVDKLVPMAMARRAGADQRQMHMRLWIACRALDGLTTEILVTGRPLDRHTAMTELTQLWCNALDIPA
ncbi:TetR/AcrR family transcriptional regulator [Stutzerimonas stutzeri]|uniref:TetR/AcrR family transcriptional regulator n=1 Tax=Stutzerimonas stutzeri TaxID=316 RepID=UPI002447184C|nr:TetR/AcrR family transcriptional regulator [Stutzerimonas stutzeri]MDH0425420.1 TetR/AcrR family transcriptional regulator [Stutzerimonas stutzeri]